MLYDKCPGCKQAYDADAIAWGLERKFRRNAVCIGGTEDLYNRHASNGSGREGRN